MRLALSARCLGLLLLSASPAFAASCPAGQTQVCLGGCICVPDPDGVIGPAQQRVGEVAATSLEGWILRSRASALNQGTAPIPPAIRQMLLPYYPTDVLDNVRYRVGDADDMAAARTMLQNPDIKAVTLVDVIVFRNEALAQDAALWAHELFHVQQYRQWGSLEFARRYTRDYDAVESPAYRQQFDVARELRQQVQRPAH